MKPAAARTAAQSGRGYRKRPHAAERVRVLAPSGGPLRDCALQRADEMVRRGRATWVSSDPPTILLTAKS